MFWKFKNDSERFLKRIIFQHREVFFFGNHIFLHPSIISFWRTISTKTIFFLQIYPFRNFEPGFGVFVDKMGAHLVKLFFKIIFWWCADDALMMHWWCPDDALRMGWLCADDGLMIHWWCTDDALMKRWWGADDAWVSYMISLNPQLFKNIAHVGSFQDFVFVFVFLCLCLCHCLCLEVDSGCHGQGHLSLYTLAQGT